MKLKSFSWITLAIGVIVLIVGVGSPFIVLHNYMSANGSVGIIGGADTPTYQFIVMGVLSGWPLCFVLFGTALLITALFCLLFSKTVKRHCTLKTSAISVGLSCVGAVGIGCAFVWYTMVAFHEMSKHPISYPVSISHGMACLLLFMALIALYFHLRMKCWSVKGFVIDVFTSVLYLPAFFFVFAYLYEWLS